MSLSVVPLSPKMQNLIQKHNTTMEMIQQELAIMAFDPNRRYSNDRRYSNYDRPQFEKAWDRLSPEMKCDKNMIITICFYFFTKGETMPDNILEASWLINKIVTASSHIRIDRNIILCLLSVMKRSTTQLTNCIDDQMIFFWRIPALKSWNDKAIVLVAMRRFPEVLLLDQHIYRNIPNHFLHDKDVFLAFVDGFDHFRPDVEFRPGLLFRFSDEIRSNLDLMLTLVQKCPICYQHIHESLKDNHEIVLAACSKDIAVLKDSCDPRLLQQLLNNKPFILRLLASESTFSRAEFYKLLLPGELQRDPDILNLLLSMRLWSNGLPTFTQFLEKFTADRHFWLSACRHYTVGSKLWQLLPDEFKDDSDFLAAVDFSCEEIALLALERLPELANSRPFWLSACANVVSSSLWQQIPHEFKNDPDFLQGLRFCDEQAVVQALHDMPQLATSRACWTAVIKSANLYGLDDLIRDHAPTEIRQDRDLMLQACGAHSPVFSVIAAPLQEDEEILAAMVEANTRDEAFLYIPLHIQSLHPDLAVRALRLLNIGYDLLLTDIDEPLWNNLEMMTLYVQLNTDNGADWDPILPEALKSIEAFGLFAAKDLDIDGPSDFAQYTSDSLRSNKAFMKKAVAIQPLCLFTGNYNLSTDFDLAVLAYSKKIVCSRELFGGRCFEHPRDYDYKSELELVHEVATKAREQVRLYEWHRDEFAPVFENPDSTPNPDHTLLPVMFKDDDTARDWKKNMLIMLGSDPETGIPDEEQVRHLRAASLHLLFTPDSWTVLNGFMPKSERFFHCD